jgi:hypothetical protein
MNNSGPYSRAEAVLDADTAREVWTSGSDGHRTGRRWLRGSLPEVRHDRTDAGNVRRSAAGTLGVGAKEQETVTLSCSRSAVRPVVVSPLAAKHEGAGSPDEKRQHHDHPVGASGRPGRAPRGAAFGPGPSCSRRIPSVLHLPRWSWTTGSRRCLRSGAGSYPSRPVAARVARR